ncbi:hypothetical protein M0R45_034549 [Rubus argutus]|uniref:Cyclic nucleotide-binding domain-containing protein n=1 Tax=Rubus argutus TaxID=59490 RepID=A0AAW1VTD6_RUBAR
MMDRMANDEVSIELRIEPKLGKKQDEGHERKGTILKEKLEAHNHNAKNWWNTFFIISCAFAVFNDPVFCYMNAIDDKHKCITWDRKLAIRYIYCRTATDVFYLFDVIISKCGCGCCCCCCRGRRCCSGSCMTCLRNMLSTLSRIYVSLPIAQILVIRMKVPDSSYYLFLTALQYTLRIYYIYGSLKRRPIIDITPVEQWLRPILGFVPFILASHIFGASWYLLATRRLMNCWVSTHTQVFNSSANLFSTDSLACDALNRTKTYPDMSNISRWDDLCPVKQADPETFDFGIFFYALQSHVVSSTHPLLQRMFQSFWWALRNLSSFGSNLNSSMDPLEIFLSVLISIGGMALFLVYLNARMQESEDRLNKLKQKEERELMKPDIDLWLYKNDVPKNMEAVTRKKKDKMKTVIIENIHKLKENDDIDLDVRNILSVLPIKEKQSIMWILFKASLKVVPVLENINEKVLKAICQHLMPVTYSEDSYIMQEGKPLGKILLITQGTAVTYANGRTSSGSSGNKWLKKGDFYGEELLNWAFKSPSFPDLPISNRNVIVQQKVEAFAITAIELKRVCLEFWWFFSREVEVSQLEQWGHLAASSIQATWRHRRARIRRAKTTGPTGWGRFVVN